MPRLTDEQRDLGRKYGVSVSLTYVDANDSWYAHIDSAAPRERMTTKDRVDPETCLQEAREFLEGISNGKNNR